MTVISEGPLSQRDDVVISLMTASVASAAVYFSRRLSIITLVGICTACECQAYAATETLQPMPSRPNVLWISCEDISAHLGCYGDTQATTPHLDQLATESIRFTHAFSCHGVCAPSRTGIITGMYPVSFGANHMRSRVALPPHIRCFPALLKEAGYYCTNNSKTDYNLIWNTDEVWHESSEKAHWKNRGDAEQPFFAVFNLTMTHESKVWPEGWKKVVQGPAG